MELKLNLSFENVFSIVNQMSLEEKEKLFAILEKTLKGKTNTSKERQIGKYDGKIWIADDFDAPLEDFKEYMP